MALKYKVGDKVRIKSIDWYHENKTSEYGDIDCGEMPFMHYMTEFCGQTVTISKTCPEEGFYEIEEDRTENGWTDEMIEDLVKEKSQSKFYIGDIVYSSTWQRDVVIQEILPDGFYKVGELYGTRWFKTHENTLCKTNTQKIVLEKKTNKEIVENNIKVDMGEVSDGYHTFNELYKYRMLYNAALFNEFAKQGTYDVHKSKKHSDGEYPFGNSNWFIVMAELPTGQISNHYEMKDWDKFQIPEKPLANKWDGHSSKDVAERLTSFTNPKKEYPKTYEECSLINGCENRIRLKIIGEFTRLINARNAYWKIAGEEIGLGKPWKPDDNKVFGIIRQHGKIQKYDDFVGGSTILEFPTAKMRDAFYENFKDLIEQCKELL